MVLPYLLPALTVVSGIVQTRRKAQEINAQNAQLAAQAAVQQRQIEDAQLQKKIAYQNWLNDSMARREQFREDMHTLRLQRQQALISGIQERASMMEQNDAVREQLTQQMEQQSASAQTYRQAAEAQTMQSMQDMAATVKASQQRIAQHNASAAQARAQVAQYRMMQSSFRPRTPNEQRALESAILRDQANALSSNETDRNAMLADMAQNSAFSSLLKRGADEAEAKAIGKLTQEMARMGQNTQRGLTMSGMIQQDRLNTIASQLQALPQQYGIQQTMANTSGLMQQRALDTQILGGNAQLNALKQSKQKRPGFFDYASQFAPLLPFAQQGISNLLAPSQPGYSTYPGVQFTPYSGTPTPYTSLTPRMQFTPYSGNPTSYEDLMP